MTRGELRLLLLLIAAKLLLVGVNLTLAGTDGLPWLRPITLAAQIGLTFALLAVLFRGRR